MLIGRDNLEKLLHYFGISINMGFIYLHQIQLIVYCTIPISLTNTDGFMSKLSKCTCNLQASKEK